MLSKTYQTHPISSNKDIISILLVDDDKLVGQVLTAALESESDLDIVKVVTNPHAAVEQISVFNPHLVIVDIEMPKINGFRLTRMILEQFPDIKVII